MKTIFKLILFIVFALIAVVILSRVFPSANPPGGGGGEATSTIAHWATVRATDVAKVAAGWSAPEWANINTAGWEDGAYIYPDGKTLAFAYINIDLLKLPAQVVIGPNRDAKKICNPACGQYPRADMFYAARSGSSYGEPQPHPLTIAVPIGGLTMVGENRAYFHLEKSDGKRTDLYYADFSDGKWSAPVRLDALNTSSGEDDPFVTADDSEIFFWSDRPDALSGKNIYHAKKVGGVWQAPELLAEPVNSNSGDMQPFLSGNTLYFTSDRDGKAKIYSSQRVGDNSWSAPQVAIESNSAVGEPTLTADGNYLYFIQMFRDETGQFNPDIMWVRKK